MDDFKRAQAAAGLPPSTDAEALRTAVFTFSMLMTVSSVCMNVTFAFLLASSLWAKLLLASAYFSADIFKISAPSLCRYFWLRNNSFFAAVIVFGLSVAISLSWLSGTGFFSETADQTENTRLTNSAEYQNNQQAQQRMRDETEAVAISPAAEQAAHAELARLQAAWELAYNKNSAYMTRNYVPKGQWYKRTARAVAEDMAPLDSAIAKQQAILAKAEQYRAKVSELERLQEVAPNSHSGQAVLPVFESLGEWFAARPQAVKVKVFVLTSIALELIGGIGWLAFGMMGKPRQFTPDELALANYEQRAQRDMMRQAFADISGDHHRAGAIDAVAENNTVTESTARHYSADFNAGLLPQDQEPAAGNVESFTQSTTSHQSSSTHSEALPSDSDSVQAIPEDGKRAVGGKYPCQHCGATYEARTTWHRYCADCRTEKDRAAMS